jgi:sirohydrochlorin ferrochelatase
MTHAITDQISTSKSATAQATVLVLAIHGSPGDPARAREEFAFLDDPARPLELLVLNDKDLPAAVQLGRIAQAHPDAQLLVAPFLLGEGFHYRHDLVPAIEAAARVGASVRLLPIFGLAEAFLRALHLAVYEQAPSGYASPIAWLVPGGTAVANELRDALELIRPDLAAHSTWYALTRAELPASLATDALPIVAVLRDGRITENLRRAWQGRHAPRALFSTRHLQAALGAWLGIALPV